jgi:hypothetical protein
MFLREISSQTSGIPAGEEKRSHERNSVGGLDWELADNQEGFYPSGGDIAPVHSEQLDHTITREETLPGRAMSTGR